MKTLRTVLATFGVTSLFYGLFALIAMRLNPAFTGRTIFQMFRDTGFVALVIGIGCVLSFVIMTVAIVSFRDDGAKKKREIAFDDEDEFLEEETLPEERAEEADESWSPEIKRMQRRALKETDEEEVPSLFDDDGDDEPERFARPEPEEPEEPEEPDIEAFDPAEIEIGDAVPEQGTVKKCIYCGKPIEADSAFCIYCGKRV